MTLLRTRVAAVPANRHAPPLAIRIVGAIAASLATSGCSGGGASCDTHPCVFASMDDPGAASGSHVVWNGEDIASFSLIDRIDLGMPPAGTCWLGSVAFPDQPVDLRAVDLELRQPIAMSCVATDGAGVELHADPGDLRDVGPGARSIPVAIWIRPAKATQVSQYLDIDGFGELMIESSRGGSAPVPYFVTPDYAKKYRLDFSSVRGGKLDMVLRFARSHADFHHGEVTTCQSCLL